MIEGRGGILAMINDEGKQPGSADLNLIPAFAKITNNPHMGTPFLPKFSGLITPASRILSLRKRLSTKYVPDVCCSVRSRAQDRPTRSFHFFFVFGPLLSNVLSIVVEKSGPKDIFKVRHFAETVTYTVNGMLAKNKDTLKGETIEAVQMSHNEIMSSIFADSSMTPHTHPLRHRPAPTRPHR